MIRDMIRKIWMSEIFCFLFHSRIKTKDHVYVIDPITQRPYGRYKCKICGRKYIANNKYDWYRVYRKKDILK